MSKTLRNVFFATSGILFAQMLGSIRSFVLAKLIDPADYGIWTGVQLVVTLAPIAGLGTVEALLKRVPYFRGKNDPDGVRRVESSVLATIALAALFVAGLFLLCPGVFPFEFVRQNLLLMQFVAASAAIGFFTSFYYYRCAAYEDFRSVGSIDALQSLFGVSCVLVGAWKWGLFGGVVGFLVAECLTWVAASRICGKAHGSVRPSFRPSLMGNAVRVGFPITIIWWVYALQTTVGRMASIAFLGNTQTGYYGAASALAMLFALVPNTIGRVFYPRVNAEVGAKADVTGFRKSVVMPTAAIALLLPMVQVVIFFLLPVIYNDFIPKYHDGLACAQILILGAFFVGLIRNGANYLIAVDMQMRLMKYVAISLAANAAGCIAAVKLGFGINGIAVMATAAGALLASLVWRRVFAELGYDYKSQWSIFSGFYLSFGGTLLSIAIVSLGFSGFTTYSRALVPVKVILALLICGAVVMSFAHTRDQMKDLYRRAVSNLAYRFGQAAVK